MNFFSNNGKRARLIGTGLLIVVFVAGALAGAAGERVLRADDAPRAGQSRDMRGGPGPRRLILDEAFADKLGLTPEQRSQIKLILDMRDVHAKHVWNEVEPRLKAVGDTTRAEIAKVLSPQQIEQLESEIARRKEAWRARHKCHADIDSAAAKTAGRKTD